MARWNDDGSCAPTARVRSGKGEPFCLTLTKQEIEDDVAVFDSEARRRHSCSCAPCVHSALSARRAGDALCPLFLLPSHSSETSGKSDRALAPAKTVALL